MSSGALISIKQALPALEVTNDELDMLHPHWKVSQASHTTGVFARRKVGICETAHDLALKAVREMQLQSPDLLKEIDGVIYCCQTPDYPMPGNSFLMARDLELGLGVYCIDVNSACSGFPQSLLLAEGLVATKVCRRILIVTADTYSKRINPGDRSTSMLFGDGAAVSIYGIPRPKDPIIFHRIIATSSLADAIGWDKFIVHSSGARSEELRSWTDHSGNKKSTDKIVMDGLCVLSFVTSKVIPQLRRFISDHAFNIASEPLFLHQASKLALDAIYQRLGVPTEAQYSNLNQIGNTVSASLPMLLDRYKEKLTPGKRAIICGFGVGFSSSALLVEA